MSSQNSRFQAHLAGQKRTYLQACLDEDLTPHVSIISMFRNSEKELDLKQYSEINLSRKGLNDEDISPFIKTIGQVTALFDLISERNSIQTIILTGNRFNDKHIQKLKDFAVLSDKDVSIISEYQTQDISQNVQKQSTQAQQMRTAPSLREQVMEKIQQAKQNLTNSSAGSSASTTHQTSREAGNVTSLPQNTQEQQHQQVSDALHASLSASNINRKSNGIPNPHPPLPSSSSSKNLSINIFNSNARTPINTQSSSSAAVSVSSVTPVSQTPSNQQQALNHQGSLKQSKIADNNLVNGMIPPLDLHRIAVQKKLKNTISSAVTERSLSPYVSQELPQQPAAAAANVLSLSAMSQNLFSSYQQLPSKSKVMNQSTEREGRQRNQIVSESQLQGGQSSNRTTGITQSSADGRNKKQMNSKSPDIRMRTLMMSRMNWLFEIRNLFESIETSGKVSIPDLVALILEKSTNMKQLIEEQDYNAKYPQEIGLAVKDVVRELRYYKGGHQITMDEIFSLVGGIQPEQAKLKRCVDIFQQGDRTYSQIEKLRKLTHSSNANKKSEMNNPDNSQSIPCTPGINQSKVTLNQAQSGMVTQSSPAKHTHSRSLQGQQALQQKASSKDIHETMKEQNQQGGLVNLETDLNSSRKNYFPSSRNMQREEARKVRGSNASPAMKEADSLNSKSANYSYQLTGNEENSKKNNQMISLIPKGGAGLPPKQSGKLNSGHKFASPPSSRQAANSFFSSASSNNHRNNSAQTLPDETEDSIRGENMSQFSTENNNNSLFNYAQQSNTHNSSSKRSTETVNSKNNSIKGSVQKTQNPQSNGSFSNQKGYLHGNCKNPEGKTLPADPKARILTEEMDVETARFSKEEQIQLICRNKNIEERNEVNKDCLLLNPSNSNSKGEKLKQGVSQNLSSRIQQQIQQQLNPQGKKELLSLRQQMTQIGLGNSGGKSVSPLRQQGQQQSQQPQVVINPLLVQPKQQQFGPKSSSPTPSQQQQHQQSQYQFYSMNSGMLKQQQQQQQQQHMQQPQSDNPNEMIHNSPFSQHVNISAIKMNDSCMKNATLSEIASQLMALGDTPHQLDPVDFLKDPNMKTIDECPLNTTPRNPAERQLLSGTSEDEGEGRRELTFSSRAMQKMMRKRARDGEIDPNSIFSFNNDDCGTQNSNHLGNGGNSHRSTFSPRSNIQTPVSHNIIMQQFQNDHQQTCNNNNNNNESLVDFLSSDPFMGNCITPNKPITDDSSSQIKRQHLLLLCEGGVAESFSANMTSENRLENNKSQYFRNAISKLTQEFDQSSTQDSRYILRQCENYIVYESDEEPFYAVCFESLKQSPEHISTLRSQSMCEFIGCISAMKICFSKIEGIFQQIDSSVMLHRNLKILNLSFNNMKSLKCLKELQQLEFLNVSFNDLENLNGLEQCTSLKELHATKNRIMNIQALVVNQVANTCLRLIDLQNNSLQSLEAIAVLKTTSIRVLNCAGNPFTQSYPNYQSILQQILPTVKILDCSEQLSSLYTFSEFSRYRQVAFADENELKTFNMRAIFIKAIATNKSAPKTLPLTSTNSASGLLQNQVQNSSQQQNIAEQNRLIRPPKFNTTNNQQPAMTMLPSASAVQSLKRSNDSIKSSSSQSQLIVSTKQQEQQQRTQYDNISNKQQFRILNSSDSSKIQQQQQQYQVDEDEQEQHQFLTDPQESLKHIAQYPGKQQGFQQISKTISKGQIPSKQQFYYDSQQQMCQQYGDENIDISNGAAVANHPTWGYSSQ